MIEKQRLFHYHRVHISTLFLLDSTLLTASLLLCLWIYPCNSWRTNVLKPLRRLPKCARYLILKLLALPTIWLFQHGLIYYSQSFFWLISWGIQAEFTGRLLNVTFPTLREQEIGGWFTVQNKMDWRDIQMQMVPLRGTDMQYLGMLSLFMGEQFHGLQKSNNSLHFPQPKPSMLPLCMLQKKLSGFTNFSVRFSNHSPIPSHFILICSPLSHSLRMAHITLEWNISIFNIISFHL